jgi:flagellar capping protein FliD
VFQINNPFSNWANDLNTAVKEIVDKCVSTNFGISTEILNRIDKLENTVMADLEKLKAAVAANLEKTDEVFAKFAETSTVLVAESAEIKRIVEVLKDKINFSVLDLDGEIEKLTNSTTKLGELGTSIESLSTDIAALVTEEEI